MADQFDTVELRKKIDELVREEEIRFAAFIDLEGQLVEGKFHEGLVPRENDTQRERLYKELAFRVSTRKAFDEELGRVKYSASRRENVVMMSFPFNNMILMITAEPNVNIDRLAYRVIQILGHSWYESFRK